MTGRHPLPVDTAFAPGRPVSGAHRTHGRPAVTLPHNPTRFVTPAPVAGACRDGDARRQSTTSSPSVLADGDSPTSSTVRPRRVPTVTPRSQPAPLPRAAGCRARPVVTRRELPVASVPRVKHHRRLAPADQSTPAAARRPLLGFGGTDPQIVRRALIVLRRRLTTAIAQSTRSRSSPSSSASSSPSETPCSRPCSSAATANSSRCRASPLFLTSS